ncbi:MAG: isochorismatase [Actinomycetota bacterium]
MTVEGPLPLPPFASPHRSAEVWRVPYAERAAQAADWARAHDVPPAAQDRRRVCLLLVDCQNTFCVPGFELYVAGRDGTGAVDDTRRIAELVYRRLGAITEIVCTLDTHTQAQIFHPFFWVDRDGRHPAGGVTVIEEDDLAHGRWRVNPAAAAALGRPLPWLERHARHYVRRLAAGGRYPLTVWPYHAMVGSPGHALVSAVEEAVFVHAAARRTAPRIEVKGENPLTEHYSVFGPEVREDADGLPLGRRNHALIEHLLTFDAVLVAGEAKSHCVAWSVEDLLADPRVRDQARRARLHLLEDCMSPVVVPGADFADQGDAAVSGFAARGVQVARSTDARLGWLP